MESNSVSKEDDEDDTGQRYFIFDNISLSILVSISNIAGYLFL